MRKFCRYCGNPLNEGSLFCGQCGSRVDPSPVPERRPSNTSFNPDIFQLGVILSGLVMIVSTFLPYITTESYDTLSLFSGHVIWLGFIYIASAVIAILFTVMDKRLPPLVASGCAFLLELYMFFQAVFQSYWAAVFSRSVSREIGFYLILFSSTTMMILSLMAFLFPKGLE